MKKFHLPLIGLLGLVVLMAAYTPPNLFEITKNIDIYTSVYRELNTYYVDEVDPNKLMREGIDAMLESLDPYTNYISEAEMEGHRFQMTGRYGGIGAVIRKVDGAVTVVEPYEGFPAFNSGLRAGDLILSIDGKNTDGKDTDAVSNILRGSPGTEVVVEYRRPYTDEGVQRITLVRQEINIDNVPYSGMLGQNIAYIRLTQFTEDAGKNVAKALRDLKSQNEVRGVILDLRGNPGGLLREAVEVSNVFLPKGEMIVSTRGKVEEWDRTFKTLNPAVDAEIPLVVLTNRGSASASEIVAGVVQDLDRGLVIGERTFGKGLFQSTRDVPYKTKLKVTTAKYYTPSGRCIQAIDYGHRNDDGSVGKFPDSLRTEFFTRNGRSVYDGGGVEPEVAVKPGEYAHITEALLTNNLVFHFANQYRTKHESIASASTFTMSDQDWTDFISFIHGKEYEYTTDSERLLDDLSKIAEEEQYMASLETELNSLRAKLKSEKDVDVAKFRAEIQHELETEIASRYYHQRGAIEATFRYDPSILKALELLNEPEQFEALLKQ